MTDIDLAIGEWLAAHTPAQIAARRAKARAVIVGRYRQAIVDRYAQAKSLRVVAEEFGITATTVARFVRAAGVPRSPSGRPVLRGGLQPWPANVKFS